jgi:transglutaminase-like putative cysteine protease
MPEQRYRVRHESDYEYGAMVTSGRHLLHLTPRSTEWQTVLEHRRKVEPMPTESSEDLDFFGNPIVRLAIDRPHDKLALVTESLVAVRMRPMPIETPAWDAVRATLAKGPVELQLELAQFIAPSPFAPIFAEAAVYAKRHLEPGRAWLPALLGLAKTIHAEFEYDTEATTVATPVRTVLARRRGVCQDFALVMASCLRSVGMPARYVSGYILTTPAPGKPRLMGADASHAWVSSWCPGVGWVDFDPTNAKNATTEFVTLGWGRDVGDVTPVRGVVLGGGAQELEVRVTMTPVEEAVTSVAKQG